jgi:chemosensory pili system protein ChpA (sensor histidine kinase/response regulator)
MADFGLDDVRESFTSDVTKFLVSVESGARNVLATAGLVPVSKLHWQEPVESMTLGLHGIAGSSSLIGMDTMSQPARKLEQLALSANESIAQINLHVQRLRRIAVACIEGAGDLRQVFQHQLEAKPADAINKSAKLSERIAIAQQEIGLSTPGASVPAGAKPDSSVHVSVARQTANKGSLTAASAAAAASTTVSAIKDSSDEGWDDQNQEELTQVFRLEAQETLTSLQAYWARLEKRATDADAVQQSLRLLHLLKGAAASVGLSQIAKQSDDLHTQLEDERSTGLTKAKAKALRASLEAIIAQVIPQDVTVMAPLDEPARTQIEVSSPEMPLPTMEETGFVDDEDPRDIFRVEAIEATAELTSLMAQVSSASGPIRGIAVSRIERVFHRLKGSALIVGETALATLFEDGQQFCEDIENTDVEGLTKLVRVIEQQFVAPVADQAVVTETRSKFTPPPEEEWQVYLEEAGSLLDDLDKLLTKIEQSDQPKTQINTMFRLYHTLKGASYSVGLSAIGRQLHAIESYLEKVVEVAGIPDLRRLVTILADEHAGIRSNVNRASSQGWINADASRTAARLAAITDKSGVAGGTSGWLASNDPGWHSALPDDIVGRLADGPVSHASHVSNASDGAQISQPESYASADSVQSDSAGASERRFIRVAADRLDGLLDHVGELVISRSRILSRIKRMNDLQFQDQDRHGAVVRLITDFASATQFTNLGGERRGGSRTTSRSAVGVEVLAATQAKVGSSSFGSLELDHYEEIHVLSRQLDESTNDINELRRSITTEMQQLQQDAEALGAVVSELQTEITQARMLTVESLFSRLQLPMRDAAGRLGRDITISTGGETVAIDKSVSDAMFGPLLHMVRNAVVHGIEPAETRIAAGKARAGKISLMARQEHGQIVLEIADDGAGLNLEKLKAAGVAKGLVAENVPLSDPSIKDLVFAQGLSTNEGTDDVAGRGVGGNVIRRAVERLNGSIEIQTVSGGGTMFRVSLPLSMSITQAILLRTGGTTLALPIAFAETIVARSGIETVDNFGRNKVKVGEHLMPVHDTRRLFPGSEILSAGVLVVCMVGAARVAVLADEIVGQEEIVVKSLGSLLDGHPIFAGSTQRGDGELVLMLDIPGVLALETESSSSAMDMPRQQSAAPGPAPGQWSRPPAAKPMSTPTAVAPAPSNPFAMTSIVPIAGSKLRILFVDDSLSVRKVGERMLLGLGVEVVTAVDGQDALDKLRSMQFSLVFTDLEMPRMHGYELIQEMQFIPAYKAIPVVVVSSRSGKKHIDQALSMGAREYLTKPFSPEVLQSIIDRLALREAPAS